MICMGDNDTVLLIKVESTRDQPVKDLEINPDEAEWVREVFMKVAEEGASGYAMAQMLNQRGLRTRQGAEFQSSNIKRMIQHKSIEQKIRQQEENHNRKKQAAEKKIKAAQYKQQRYEDEVLKCLEGESAFSQEMLARLITQAEAEVRQAKDEYAALLQNNDDRTTVQQIRSYYDEFFGWANEFNLATVERKRVILAQLFEKVEVGKGYKITIHVRGTYKQFLGEEPHGKF